MLGHAKKKYFAVFFAVSAIAETHTFSEKHASCEIMFSNCTQEMFKTKNVERDVLSYGCLKWTPSESPSAQVAVGIESPSTQVVVGIETLRSQVDVAIRTRIFPYTHAFAHVHTFLYT